MRRCDICDIDYPTALVNESESSAGRAMLCGICALNLSSILHGVKRTMFGGQAAEMLRQEAIKHRQRGHRYEPSH